MGNLFGKESGGHPLNEELLLRKQKQKQKQESRLLLRQQQQPGGVVRVKVRMTVKELKELMGEVAESKGRMELGDAILQECLEGQRPAKINGGGRADRKVKFLLPPSIEEDS